MVTAALELSAEALSSPILSSLVLNQVSIILPVLL
jgi:hypothetical protein